MHSGCNRIITNDILGDCLVNMTMSCTNLCLILVQFVITLAGVVIVAIVTVDCYRRSVCRSFRQGDFCEAVLPGFIVLVILTK